MVETGYVDSENPYLYDCSGAYKKVIDYGTMPVNDDLEDYDVGAQMQDAFVKDDGTYSVKN